MFEDFYAYYEMRPVLDYVLDYNSFRYVIDNMTHVSQCVLILGMSFERFLLICHPAKAKILYTTKYKVMFYALLSLLKAVLCAHLFVDLFVIEQPKNVKTTE